MYSTIEVSLHSQSEWYFEIVFWMIWVSIYNFYKNKTVWQFDVRCQVTQDLGDTHLF